MRLYQADKCRRRLKPELRRFFILALSQVVGGTVLAGQPAQDSPAVPAAHTNATVRFHTNPALSNSVPAIPTPPIPSSPVKYFRELLAMSAADRIRALSNRPPENRKQIMAKIREYLSLGQNERELRLRATELEWYLVPLMRMARADRGPRIAAVPEDERKMIESRLAEWDQLPDSVRKDLLDKRQSIRLYMQMTSGIVAQTNSNPGAPRKLSVEEELKKIQAMSDEDRQKLIVRFNRYFELSDREKDKVLQTLSPIEQEQLEKSLRKFRGLTVAQRAHCIRSFEQFASMSPADRQQFLKNAEKWIIMTPEQRAAWRDVVEKVSITPPVVANAPKPPPMPPVIRKAEPVTNGN
jgi:Protein of unknown function (DUF3106)